MSKSKNPTYFLVDQKYLERMGNYLGKNSSEYAFSPEKGEESNVLFIDNKKRIFAIINNDESEIELAYYTPSKIKKGIENILKSGVKN